MNARTSPDTHEQPVGWQQSEETRSRQPQAPAPVEPATASAAGTPATAQGQEPQAGPNWLRRILLAAGPVIVGITCVVVWLGGGRYQKTEDAYVKADKVVVSAEVAGPIEGVEVKENQRVDAAQVLFRIDDRPYSIALAGAEAQLAAATTEFHTVKAGLQQKTEELQLAISNRDFAEREFTRQSVLAKNKMNSGAALDEAKHALDTARQEISVTEQERAQHLARLDGDPALPVERFPAYLAAKAKRDQAALDLERTVVRAPFAGVASKVPQRHQYATAGSAVMSVVAADGAWVEANFMETDMTDIRVGQPATIEIDTYPGRQWQGHVKSISQATGAEFSILPPQNASGNWVKITQRIPVRIAVDAREDDPPLRAGMTATIVVDTGKRRSLASLFGSGRQAGGAG